MVYETSYEVGRKPFNPDVNRGFWSNPKDFMWACMGISLKLDCLLFFNSGLYESRIFGIVIYFVCAYLYVVPLMVLQSFMGQFSSSGFISALRLAPLFKGMAYVCLVLNLVVLFSYSVLASVPLFFMLNSLSPILPWSCEAQEMWDTNKTTLGDTITCNTKSTMVFNETDPDLYVISGMLSIPSVAFFRKHFDDLLFTNSSQTSVSFEMMACIITIWIIIGVIFYICNSIEKLGIFVRYAVWMVYGMLFICLMRFSFLPGASQAIYDYFFNAHLNLIPRLTLVPLFVMNCFGGGFGTITALASHNNFKVDIIKYSWLINLGQMFSMLGLSMVLSLTEAHFKNSDYFHHDISSSWAIFLTTASAIARMSLANLWSFFFYAMLTLCAIILICTQMLGILTNLFDEFEILRSRKKEVTFGLITFLALSSLYFSTNHGLTHYATICADSLFSQIALSFIFILVLLWVYGRVRFQRDIEFMLNKSLGNFRIFLLRFIAPLCLLGVLTITLANTILHHFFGSDFYITTTIVYGLLPWLIFPVFAIYLMLQNSGSFVMRFKRACRPYDWYPVNSEQRQKYEEANNNTDITHQLTEVVDVTEEVYF